MRAATVCTKYNKHFSRGQLTQTLFSCLLNEQNMQMHSNVGRNASFSLYVSGDTTNCKDIYEISSNQQLDSALQQLGTTSKVKDLSNILRHFLDI